jgi:glycine oxidase
MMSDRGGEVATTADALVIGGGVMGLLIARELRARGRDVVVLERDQPGRQASWASAGILTGRAARADDPATALDNLSADLYDELVTSLRDKTGLDVERTMNGWIVPAFDDQEAAGLEHQARALRQAGDDVEFVQGAGVQSAEPALGPAVVAGLLMPGGQIDNRRLLRALELDLERAGVSVKSGAAVTEVTYTGDRVTGTRTLAGDFTSPIVVNAAGSWSGRIPGMLPEVPVVPQRGQILALWRGNVPFRRVVMTPRDPYLVPRIDGRIIVGATREFVGYDASMTADGISWLLRSATTIAPGLASARIAEMWTGFRPVSLDGFPFIGPGQLEGLYFATGHGPHGISPAPGTARLLATLIAGEEPPIDPRPFSPLRAVVR